MKVASKFLTAEVRLTAIHVRAGRLIVEGLVKDLMPMTVELDVADLRTAMRMLLSPLRARLERLWPPARRRGAG